MLVNRQRDQLLKSANYSRGKAPYLGCGPAMFINDVPSQG